MKPAKETVQAPRAGQELRPASPRNKRTSHLALLKAEGRSLERDRKSAAHPANHLRAGPVPPLRESHSPGETLPAPLRAALSPLVGPRAIGEARLHTDDVAAAIARAHNAHAVTLGNDIYFAEGRYLP